MKSSIFALALVACLAAPVARASGNQNDQGQNSGNQNSQGNQGGNGGGWVPRVDPAVPEPVAALVFGVGLLTIAGVGRRRA